MPSGTVSTYLERYAVAADQFESLIPFLRRYSRGLCLPLRGETHFSVLSLLDHLGTHLAPRHSPLVVVAVLNENLQSAPRFREIHQESVQHIKRSAFKQSGQFYLQRLSESIDVLWIDYTHSHAFAPKQGVGLARKAGCDLLLRIKQLNLLDSPWLWTTDADARIPTDYFDLEESEHGAVHYTYNHDVSHFEGDEALTLYEIHLRYYVLGLLWANSPFAFPTIGSCLALHFEKYAQVRGFPDREAGEDFHLLNKLSKISKIRVRAGLPIVLKGRFSDRVPFGTGKATTEIHHLLKTGQLFSLYSPQAFEYLHSFLQGSRAILDGDTSDLDGKLLEFRKTMAQSSPVSDTLFNELQIERILMEAMTSRRDTQNRHLHFHGAFDGLKTLRLIHLLHQGHLRKQDWRLALKSAPFCHFLSDFTCARSALEQMRHQEETLICS
ncbi:hypothetical protein EBR78_04580 [bacterium]|nr:hypothetical protein [bacterium]